MNNFYDIIEIVIMVILLIINSFILGVNVCKYIGEKNEK